MNKTLKLTVCALLALAVASMADIFIKQQTTTISGSGAKEKSDTEETSVWITQDRMASIGPESSMILRLDKGVAYSIDNKKKKYTEIPFSAFNTEGDAQTDDLPPMFSNMMKMSVTIEPTEETKTIRSWNCKKYIQTIEMMGGTTVSELWVTEDIKVPDELLKKFSAAVMAQTPELKQLGAQMLKEAEKMPGYVVQSTSQTKIMGQESRSIVKVLEMDESNPPEGIYEVPEKFKKKKYE